MIPNRCCVERGFSMRALDIFGAALVAGLLGSGAVGQELDARIDAALGGLAAGFPAGEAEGFAAVLADPSLGLTGDTLGHLLYVRRHFDKAAWFFGQDALGDLSDPVSLSNFSAMLAEASAADPGAGADWAEVAYAAAAAAVALRPGDAALLNNLGNAARLTGRSDEAVAAARRASELVADEPLYWTNLARALEAAGDGDAAAEALAMAHGLAPNSMAVLETATALPGAAPAYQAALGRSCTVDFRCQEICPRSIIGGIMSVTCEMESASAQMACTEGRPYPTSYRCEEDLPEYGILIPGLNAGFSVAVPGFSVHVLVQGDGTVDVRVEAGASVGPVGGYLRGDGHFSPSNGASFDKLGGGVRINVLPKSPANDLASGLGHPPVHIEAETLDGKPVQINVETYNAGVISH